MGDTPNSEGAGRRWRVGTIRWFGDAAVVRSRIESELSEARRHAAEGRSQVDHQRRTLEGLRRDGRDIRLAEDLLQVLLERQDNFEKEVARLEAESKLRTKSKK